MSLISLEGMEFYAYHGCFKEEQIIGTKFIIDLQISLDTTHPEKTDNLSDSLNYQNIYLLIKKEMQIKSNLLEHIGRRILNSLKKEFPNIENAILKISKLNPPLGGKIKNVSLTINL